MPGPEEKKQSGTGHAQPIDGSASSAESGNASSEITARDFWTRRPMPPAPGVRMPPQSRPSPGIGIKNKELKQQHFQFVPDFKGAKEYAESVRGADEQYRQANAAHPSESLLSVHNNLNFDDPEYFAAPHDVAQMVGYQAFGIAGRSPKSMVVPGLEFRQTDCGETGDGICQTLSASFLLYRRLGYDCQEIFGMFRQHGKAFIKLHKDTFFHLTLNMGNKASRHLHDVEKSLLNGVIPGLQSSPATKPESRWPKAGAAAGVGPSSGRREEKLAGPHVAAHRPLPAGANVASECLSFFSVAGHFELDRTKPYTSNAILTNSLLWMLGVTGFKNRHHGDISARGMTAKWAVPRMDAASRKAALIGKGTSLEYAEDPLNPQIGCHLFAGMERTRRQSVAGGQTLVSFPYILVIVKGTSGAHAVVVEFNTDAADQVITSPRGYFDPNYGWIGAKQGFCSLDLDLVLHSLYLYDIQDEPGKSTAPPGCLVALQLQTITNGAAEDPAYVLKRGSIPSPHGRSDYKM